LKRSILAKYDEEIDGRQQSVSLFPNWTDYTIFIGT
jgi:hypothetical protein